MEIPTWLQVTSMMVLNASRKAVLVWQVFVWTCPTTLLQVKYKNLYKLKSFWIFSTVRANNNK